MKKWNQEKMFNPGMHWTGFPARRAAKTAVESRNYPEN